MDKYTMKCKYTGPSDELRAELFKLLKPEDRIDSLIIREYRNPPQASLPNRKIEIIFYAKENDSSIN